MTDSPTAQSSPFKRQLKFTGILLALITVIELINLFSANSLNQFGLIPRRLDHIYGIFTSPFLHASLRHYMANIVPLGVFVMLTLQYGTKRFIGVSLWIMAISGLGVWIIGRDAEHVGASGMIYGYFGYLLLAGFLTRRIKLIAISLLVGFFYGGIVWGVLPGVRPFVSWEYHLCGLLAGLAAAYWWSKPATGQA